MHVKLCSKVFSGLMLLERQFTYFKWGIVNSLVNKHESNLKTKHATIIWMNCKPSMQDPNMASYEYKSLLASTLIEKDAKYYNLFQIDL